MFRVPFVNKKIGKFNYQFYSSWNINLFPLGSGCNSVVSSLPCRQVPSFSGQSNSPTWVWWEPSVIMLGTLDDHEQNPLGTILCTCLYEFKPLEGVCICTSCSFAFTLNSTKGLPYRRTIGTLNMLVYGSTQEHAVTIPWIWGCHKFHCFESLSFLLDRQSLQW